MPLLYAIVEYANANVDEAIRKINEGLYCFFLISQLKISCLIGNVLVKGLVILMNIFI